MEFTNGMMDGMGLPPSAPRQFSSLYCPARQCVPWACVCGAARRALAFPFLRPMLICRHLEGSNNDPKRGHDQNLTERKCTMLRKLKYLPVAMALLAVASIASAGEPSGSTQDVTQQHAHSQDKGMMGDGGMGGDMSGMMDMMQMMNKMGPMMERCNEMMEAMTDHMKTAPHSIETPEDNG